MSDTNDTEEASTEQKPEIRKGLRAIWRHVRPFKKELVVLVVLGVVSAIANGFVPYVTGRFFDTLINLSQGTETFTASTFPLWVVLLGAWVLVQLVANNVDWVMDRMRRRVDIGVHLGIQTTGFKHLLHAPMVYHKSVHINGVMQKISTTGWRVSAIVGTVVNIAPQFLSIIIGLTLAASINTFLAGILVVGVLLYIALLLRILAPIAAIDAAAHKSWSEGWDDVAQAITQIESVKQATTEEYESQAVQKSLRERTYNLWAHIERNWSNVSFFQRMIVLVTQFTVFIFSVKFISNGTITVGELVALNGYALMFFGPFVSLGHSWQTIQNGITVAAQAEEIFDGEEENYVPEGAITPEHFSGEVVFENASFAYGEDQPDVLAGVDFKVHAGQVVAFVGESGVGKSTAISLISGYYFPTKGRVLVDGVDTRKLDLINLRRNIAMVPQEVALFNDTIKSNISYGSPDASAEDIARATEEAHAREFIEALPLKYETIVGERGIKLSVGQKQRVSIARAILRDPKILILDEPTSALDSETERKVTEALEKLMKGRTTFIIAHRLSTVRKADRIFVIEKGKIVEEGSHDELMKIENGNYRHRYELHIGLV
ncbi:MAG: ABC transporter-related protein [Parcubacteria group bacterium GW2011_GWA1_47_8]|nr:MAG: ABC transporter-related protein [Parcubacteria group bacterium GW2011_GWA1_47_8]